MAAAGTAIRIPHMGWNNIRSRQPHALLNDLPPEPRFYFVHSYHFVCEREVHALAVTEHGYEFTSVVASGNILGTQFHPEKSHKYGISLLRSFIRSDFRAHIESDSQPAAERRRAG
jgi:glutamine amidotransferase